MHYIDAFQLDGWDRVSKRVFGSYVSGLFWGKSRKGYPRLSIRP